jgi:predicted ATPase
MVSSIEQITISGFKSIRSLLNFKLRKINILIGANGAGKSNFVNFFSFLHDLINKELELTVNRGGGADTYLFFGPKITSQFSAQLSFGLNGYSFNLEPTVDGRLIFADERIQYKGNCTIDRSIGRGHSESKLINQLTDSSNKQISRYIHEAISSWTLYHFHDTSGTAPMRRGGSVRDYERLRKDGANLAAFLFNLKTANASVYALIRDTIRLVAPFFDDFILRPKEGTEDPIIQLEWKQQNSDYPLHVAQFSDGTLRFIALATALLQPLPPSTILIDEPELGLHPFALNVLTGLIASASNRTQVIVSTQSPNFLNAFEPEDIVVIDRQNGESTFKRLSEESLRSWLDEEYTLGDLWQKSVYGGSPSHE